MPNVKAAIRLRIIPAVFHLPHKRKRPATNFLQGGRHPQTHSFVRTAPNSPLYETCLVWQCECHGTSTCGAVETAFEKSQLLLMPRDESRASFFTYGQIECADDYNLDAQVERFDIGARRHDGERPQDDRKCTTAPTLGVPGSSSAPASILASYANCNSASIRVGPRAVTSIPDCRSVDRRATHLSSDRCVCRYAQ